MSYLKNLNKYLSEMLYVIWVVLIVLDLDKSPLLTEELFSLDFFLFVDLLSLNGSAVS